MLSTLQMTVPLVQSTATPSDLSHLTFKLVCVRQAVPTTPSMLLAPLHQGCTNPTMSALRPANTTRTANTSNAILSVFAVCAQVPTDERIHHLIAGVELQCCLNIGSAYASVSGCGSCLMVAMGVECCRMMLELSDGGSGCGRVGVWNVA